MIIKIHHPDGSIDLMVQCDIPSCDRISTVIGSVQWLIPTHPDMPTYCPDCLVFLALLLIGSALACPCGSCEIRLHINNNPGPDSRWPSWAECATCGLILMINNTPNFPEW